MIAAALATQAFQDYPDGLLLVNPQTFRICAVNRRACQLLGYQADELHEKEILEIESSIEGMFYWEEVRAGNCRDAELHNGGYHCKDGEVLEVIKRICARFNVGWDEIPASEALGFHPSLRPSRRARGAMSRPWRWPTSWPALPGPCSARMPTMI